jgi:uncharacterized protein (TIGR00251 family)
MNEAYSRLISETPDGITFRIHLQPRASRNEICGIQGDEIKVRVTSPPVDDAANRLCAEFIAGLLGVAKSKATIVSGHKSRHKTLRVSGVTRDSLLGLLPKE